MSAITFFVPGTPVAKGSARAFFRKGMAHPVVVQDNSERQKPWASLISIMAQQAGLSPVENGCVLHLCFNMPRPKSHFRANGDVKPAHFERPHTSKPDLDKLIRCVLDALTGVAYLDDSQVVFVNAKKEYAHPSMAGCSIGVEYKAGNERSQHGNQS